MLVLVRVPAAVGQNFSGSALPPRVTPAWTTPLSPTTMMTNGERVAVCADALRGIKPSSSGRPSIKPPAPRSTVRRFISKASRFFIASLRSGKAIEERIARHDAELEIAQGGHPGPGEPGVVVDHGLLVAGQLPTVQVAHHVLQVAGVGLLGVREEM